MFAQLKASVNAEIVKKVGAVFRFDITTGCATRIALGPPSRAICPPSRGGKRRSWVAELKTGNGSIDEVPADSTAKADCTIAMAVRDRAR